MKMIAPVTVDETVLIASNVAENDYPEWDNTVTYASGARVIIAAVHKVYEGVAGSNTGNDPETDDGTWWVEVGATNKWKAFDRKIGQSTTQSGTITYELDLPGICSGVGFLGLSAGTVTVEVEDPQGIITYSKSQQLVDSTGIVDYFTYYTYSPEYSPKVIFSDIPGYTGHTMRITIDAGSGEAQVGEIVVGRQYDLATTIEGTQTGFESLSVKNRDAFGNIDITPRGFYDTVDFRIAIPVGGEERLGRIIREFIDKPALYYADESLLKRGTIVYGFPLGLRPTLQARGVSYANIEIEGLV